VVIPGGVRHWGEVIGDEPVLNLDVFTPKRPEYAP
jgi:quercetin dioxygenase-like cupin family protein